MNKICAIVIPVYKPSLAWNEVISLKRTLEVFGAKNEIILVFPEGMSVKEYKDFGLITKYLPLNKKYFKSVFSYSTLMIKPYFYKHFLDYKFILINQLDTFIFENNLLDWCHEGYDFIGAPWINVEWIKDLKKKVNWIDRFIYPIGNGGFSLRNTKSFYNASLILWPISLIWKPKWHEDIFWGTIANRLIPGFKVPSIKVALRFAWEENPQTCIKLNDMKLPLGCHAWEKFNPEFWAIQFEKYGYNLSNQQNS